MAETMKEMDERRARIMALGDGVYGKEFVDNVFSKTEHEKDCDGNVEWCDLCWKEHMLAIARTIRESDQAKKLAVVPEEATREMVRPVTGGVLHMVQHISRL